MQRKASRIAFKVALIYVIVAGLWVLFSDQLMALLARGEDTKWMAISLVKGLGFVIVTGILLNLLLKHWLKQWAQELEQRKRAETTQMESEERYKALFERSLECVFLADFEGNFLEANQAALDLLGYQRADIATLNFASLLSEDQLPLAFRTLEEIKKTGHQLVPSEYRLRMRDGRQVFVETQSSLIYREGRPFAIQGIARDMTAHKLAEHSLRESERRYQQLFELESDAIILVDSETLRFVDVNLSAQRLYGYTRDEFLAMKLESISAEPERTREVFHKIGTGSQIHVPLRWHLKKDGRRVAVEINANEIEHRGRRTQLAAIRDITQRQQVMDMLRETTSQLTEAQRMASLGSYDLDLKTGLWTGSEVLDEIFGIVDPAFKKDVAGWLRIVHPQDRAEMDRYFREEISTGRRVFDRQYRIVRLNDQEECWVHGLGKLIRDEQGQIVRLVGTIQDITKRKQTEVSYMRLATAVEQATETIVITDTDGVIVYTNPAFEQSTGFTRAEAVGQNPRLLRSGNQDAQFYRQMWDTIKRGEVWTGHFINRRKNGLLYEEEASISPVRDDAGRIVNYVAVKRDVTREMQLEAQFRQAQKMEAIGTLAGGIAHDFNNILSAMFGYAYLLQMDVAENRAALEKVEEILKSAARAKDLVHQILTFSRQREQTRQVIPLETVVKEAIKFLRASLPANIQIEVDLAANTPAVLADPTQIYQVTINLAANALHAMEGRPGRLTVSLESFLPDQEFIRMHPEFQSIQYARLTVADNGHGMDAKTLERIFEPFFTTKPVGKGTGLGLSVVHGIVQSHHGVISVESRPEQGTIFHICFPGQQPVEALSRKPEGQVASGRGQKILLVDDETALTSMFQLLLKLLDYEVSSHNSARAALSVFHNDPARFDLVITDLTMPEINGLDMAREMRACRPDLPVILLTGLTSTVGQAELAEAGICEMLEKPVSLQMLAESLQRALKPG